MTDTELLKTADGASLAYLGDCVFELWVRKTLLFSGLKGTGALNEASKHYVTAKKQSEAFHKIETVLTDEELAFFKRGRNSSHLNSPKSATGAEYRTATGFEALCAALFISGKEDRLYELLSLAFAD